MKKYLKGYLAGILTMVLLLGSFAAFAGDGTKTISVALNKINIAVSGKSVAKVGDTYTLDSGKIMPYSILYDGTTYLPLRKVSELVGKDVGWDGPTNTANIKDKTVAVTTTNARTNPAKIGSKVTTLREDYLDGKSTIELTVTDSIRGQAAWDIVSAENPFNSAPKAGMEYILIKFKVKLVQSENDKPIDVNFTFFDLIRANGTEYTDISFEVIPNCLEGDMYAGAEKEGYLCFTVDQADKPLIRFSNKYEGYVWFDPNK